MAPRCSATLAEHTAMRTGLLAATTRAEGLILREDAEACLLLHPPTRTALVIAILFPFTMARTPSKEQVSPALHVRRPRKHRERKRSLPVPPAPSSSPDAASAKKKLRRLLLRRGTVPQRTFRDETRRSKCARQTDFVLGPDASAATRSPHFIPRTLPLSRLFLRRRFSLEVSQNK